MKKNDLTIMITVALSTATLTVASFWAGPLEAGGEAETLAPKIAKPKLVARGVEMSLSTVGETPQTGDEPVFELAAVNTSAEPAELKLHLMMTAMSPADALSRVARMPRKLWECNQSITLRANETKQFTLASGTKLPAKNIISINLSEGVVAGSLHSSVNAVEGIALGSAGRPGITALTFATTDSAAGTIGLAGPGDNMPTVVALDRNL